MDLLCKRYSASPFIFLNGFLQTGRFCDFIDNFITTVQEEKEEQKLWEYFLMRVWEGSFEDFKENIKNNEKHANMSANEIETTVNYSMNILNNFNPEKEG